MKVGNRCKTRCRYFEKFLFWFKRKFLCYQI